MIFCEKKKSIQDNRIKISLYILNMRKIYKDNIEKVTLYNQNYRKVLFTTPQMQLVVMNIEPGQQIGMETHEDVTQFVRVESGRGKAVVSGKDYRLKDGDAIIIPARTKHNIIASKNDHLKLYVIYAPPEHPKNITQLHKPI